MWYWNPSSGNEALPGVHDLTDCIMIDEDAHSFKTTATPSGKIWSSDSAGHPVLVDVPPLTDAELIAVAEVEKQRLITAATSAIVPLNDAVALDMATDGERKLYDEWRQYRVLLTRVDTAAIPISWPTPPEG